MDNKLQANELRIGNWVKYEGQDVLVMELYRNDLELGYFSDSIGFNRKYTEINPIPLTEEWLERLGFKHNYSETEDGEVCVDNYSISLGKYSNLTIEKDFSFGVDSKDFEDLICFENDYILSVHRLQNIYFALTGKELELK